MPSEPKPLKKDYVTYLAIGLFAVVVVFELALVVFVPIHLRSDRIWAREVAFQEMIQLQDLLRAKMIDYKKITVYDKGNIALMKVCLDRIADYLRAHRETLDVNQINAVDAELCRFETLYFDMEKSLFTIKAEKIDPSQFLERLKSKVGGPKNDNEPLRFDDD